jgi:hypothetical protein
MLEKSHSEDKLLRRLSIISALYLDDDAKNLNQDDLIDFSKNFLRQLIYSQINNQQNKIIEFL